MRVQLLSKGYGIKYPAIGNILVNPSRIWEHVEIASKGTWLEHVGNLM
jgi:hypothetical protein